MGDPIGLEVCRIVSFEDFRLVLKARNGDPLELTRGAGDMEPWVQADLDGLKWDIPVRSD